MAPIRGLAKNAANGPTKSRSQFDSPGVGGASAAGLGSAKKW